jgi:hypothetical protein
VTINDFVDGVHNANRMAKIAATLQERQEWYAVKAALISAMIESDRLGRVLFSYEWNDRGSYLVVITLLGKRSGTWHMPMEHLSCAAQQTVIHHLGPPSRHRPGAKLYVHEH